MEILLERIERLEKTVHSLESKIDSLQDEVDNLSDKNGCYHEQTRTELHTKGHGYGRRDIYKKVCMCCGTSWIDN